MSQTDNYILTLKQIINLEDEKGYVKINLGKVGRDFAQVQCKIKMVQ